MILKNIEIKARIMDYTKVKRLVEDLCNTPVETEQQEDTFFNSPTGRLKLQESGKTSTIMYYNRLNSFGPKQSTISLSFIDNPSGLKSVLEKSHGIRGIVKKKDII